MPTDLFPGFSGHHIPTPAGTTIFTRVSPPSSVPAKPPLLLIHGFPQTHIEWHKLAPLLTDHFTLILVDLRGYGASSLAPTSENGSGYTKRLMAQDCVAVMDHLGYTDKFFVVGHDRGARVAYRLAFDSPERVEKLVVLDVVPTASMFMSFGNAAKAWKAYHWLFLAQPAPFPENMIAGVDGGKTFLENSLASWAGSKSLEAFAEDQGVLQQYREAYCVAERIHATCEDYRAGVFYDRVYDEDDLEQGKKIELPVLAIWGKKWLAGGGVSPLDVWRQYAVDVEGKGLDCGHFIPEEDPEALAKELLPFLLS
ncbi:Alpha/Beta hydrolase protein [Aspergillus heterothallicus]